MESHKRLLVITIFSFLVLNSENSKFVQNVAAESGSPASAPNLQPAVSPSPQADSPDYVSSPSPTSLPPLGHVSFPPSQAYPPSDSLPPSESDSSDGSPPSESDSPDGSPPSESNSPDGSPSIADAPSEAFAPSNNDGDIPALPPSANVDPEIMEICNATDYPALCLSTIVPRLNGSTDVFSVVEIAIKASNEYAEFALSMLKRLAAIPGTPAQLVSILNDCKESYEDVLYNFENAMTALPARDIGTMNTMLSAVLTDADDCDDEFTGANIPSPMSKVSVNLENMTSNCLAIISLTQ